MAVSYGSQLPPSPMPSNLSGSRSTPSVVMAPGSNLARVPSMAVSTASMLAPLSSRGPPLAAPPHVPAPQPLTVGLPDPNSVQNQKAGFIKSLDEQLKTGAASLDQQVREQREQVRAQAEQQKAIFAMQVDQEVRMQEMKVEHRFATQVKELKQQAMRQRAALEQQALQLSLEYQGRRAEQDMQVQHYTLQQEHHTLQEKIRSLPNVYVPLPSDPALASVTHLLPNHPGPGPASGVTPIPSYVPGTTTPRVPASVMTATLPTIASAPAVGYAAPPTMMATAPTVISQVPTLQLRPGSVIAAARGPPTLA
eukprot:TRINITY_DN91015_c0_g1_i1.p1 TRINITY_DN91015_c0_g1~~TRINITY_DN91015_c0_g1_i1.p1  ORF type:complete len:309 (+),score=85.27 TRINITY_DN91015_c0_g1_i1:82-1008(+)